MKALAPSCCLDCRFFAQGLQSAPVSTYLEDVKLKVGWCLMHLAWEWEDGQCPVGIRDDRAA